MIEPDSTAHVLASEEHKILDEEKSEPAGFDDSTPTENCFSLALVSCRAFASYTFVLKLTSHTTHMPLLEDGTPRGPENVTLLSLTLPLSLPHLQYLSPRQNERESHMWVYPETALKLETIAMKFSIPLHEQFSSKLIFAQKVLNISQRQRKMHQFSCNFQKSTNLYPIQHLQKLSDRFS